MNLRLWLKRPNNIHELVLGKSGPVPETFVLSFSFFSRIVTTAWLKLSRGTNGLPNSPVFSSQLPSSGLTKCDQS